MLKNLTDLIPVTTIWNRYYYTPFVDEKSEGQSGYILP